MEKNQFNIAIIEDDPVFLMKLSGFLKALGHISQECTDIQGALDQVHNRSIDLIISDVNLEKECGLDLIQKLKDCGLSIPVIFITSSSDLELAVKAIKNGASDYLNKFHTIEELGQKINHAVQFHDLNRKARQSTKSSQGKTDIIAKSAEMKIVMNMVESISSVDATVLITGESGTGKEVFAKYIHECSSRRDQKFRAINCASIPSELIESELFGHLKGSFTDAKKDRKGIFQEADHGTLLLDEIGDMPLNMQVKLLRVLQEKHIKPIGGDNPIPIDTRIIAATNKDLKELISKGLFREDLYYRLNVLLLNLPSLKQRKEDIASLANYFFLKFSKKYNKTNLKSFSENAMCDLTSYDWPGNVRELENIIERAVILSHGPQIDRLQIDSAIGIKKDSESFNKLKDIEKIYIRKVLISTNWDVKKAAGVMDIGWRSLYRKMDNYAIEKELSY